MKPAKPSETQTHQVSPFGRENPYKTTETTPLKGWFRGFGFQATQRDDRTFLVEHENQLSDLDSGWQVPWIIFLLVVLAITGVGVIQNARYGMRLDAASGSQSFAFLGIAFGSFGIIFAILNLSKVMAPPAIIEAWRRGHRVVAAVIAIAFLGLAGLSIWNITAIQTIVRYESEAAVEVERERLAVLRDELVQTSARARALGESRLSAVIERELQAMRHDVRWSLSEECQNATAKASRSFCADYARIFGELARAFAVEQTRLKAERLRGEIADRTTASAVGTSALGTGDPELLQISRLTGLDIADVGWWRSVVLAVIFELVEAFGLTLAWIVRPVSHHFGGEGAPVRAGALVNSGKPSPRWPAVEPSNRPSAHAPLAAPRDDPAVGKQPPPYDRAVVQLPREPAPDARKSVDQAGSSAQMRPAGQPVPAQERQPAPPVTSSTALRLVASGAAPESGQVEADPIASVRGAIASFVALLEASGDWRTTGGELFKAYEAMRAERGWPQMTQTAFGRQIRVAVEVRGGRKIKSRGQQVYLGFVVPQQGRIEHGRRVPIGCN